MRTNSLSVVLHRTPKERKRKREGTKEERREGGRKVGRKEGMWVGREGGKK